MDPIDTIRDALRGAVLGDQQQRIIDLALQELALSDRSRERLAQENVELRRLLDEAKARLQHGVPRLPRCPFCGAAAWTLVESAPHPQMGMVGINSNRYACGACGKSMTKQEE